MSDPIVGTVPSPVITCANCGEAVAPEYARVVFGDRVTHHPECPSVQCPECKRAWFAAGRPIADGLRLPHDACAS